MAVSSEYREFALEQLGRVTRVTWRRMFGAVGIYGDGLFFAIISDDTLYFKTDDETRTDFEAAGMEPFRPYGDERTMAYHAVPGEVLEDMERLGEWVERALAVARRAKRR